MTVPAAASQPGTPERISIGIMGTIIVPFVGFLFDRRGDYVVAFWFLAILVVAATAFVAPIRHDNVSLRKLPVQPQATGAQKS